MSQAKVDRYKEEKKNREKNIKKNRRKKVASIFVVAAVVGAIMGYPLGKFLYKQSVEKREESATIIASAFDYWSQQYWAANYSEMFDFSNSGLDMTDATSTDATATDVTPESATITDAN